MARRMRHAGLRKPDVVARALAMNGSAAALTDHSAFYPGREASPGLRKAFVHRHIGSENDRPRSGAGFQGGVGLRGPAQREPQSYPRP